MKTCSAFSFCSGNVRSYWEGTDGCTANQERKRKETITLFATRQICFRQILVGIIGWAMGLSKDDMQTVMPGKSIKII
jgi:hypothetical protein